VIDLLAPAASTRGNTLIGDWIAQEIPTLNGDPTRLRQVLYNLVGNANKFTDHGTVILSIRPLTPAPGDAAGLQRLRFEVRDTGIGIAPEVLPGLFRPFEQADTSTTRRFGGTGLGLAICRRLVEAMDGEIGVDSTPGEGSTFWFTLTLPIVAHGLRPDGDATLPATAAVTAPAAAAAAPPQDGVLLILLAEDNPTNQLLLTTRLHRAGHRVDVVANGEEAVDAVARHDYDVVLMDMQMPALDGASATRRIRALDGPRAKVPVVALTADALPEFRQRYMDAGLDDYLTKPVEWDRLERVLSRYRPAAPAPRAAAPAPAAAAADEAQVDALQVRKVRADLGDDVFDDVLALYWPRTTADLDACGQALADGDLDALRRSAHSVKGSSASLGFESVTRAAARLAEASPEQAGAAFASVQHAFERVRAAYGLELHG